MIKGWGMKPTTKGMKLLMNLCVILLSVFVLSGCGTLQTLVKKDGETSPLADWIGGAGGTAQEETIPAISNQGDGKTVSLYFPDSSGKALIKEERTLPKTLSLARETVNQWLRGPAVQGSSQAAVDPSTTLVDISIKEGVATVDLSREFTQVYGNVTPEVTVYGLVNTLTQFPTVREVKLRIEGKAITKIGSLDVSNLSYREGLVKESSVNVNSSAGSGSVLPGNSTGVSADGSKEGNSSVKGSDSPSTINLFSSSGGTT
jgi:hypothetical protein